MQAGDRITEIGRKRVEQLKGLDGLRPVEAPVGDAGGVDGRPLLVLLGLFVERAEFGGLIEVGQAQFQHSGVDRLDAPVAVGAEEHTANRDALVAGVGCLRRLELLDGCVPVAGVEGGFGFGVEGRGGLQAGGGGRQGGRSGGGGGRGRGDVQGGAGLSQARGGVQIVRVDIHDIFKPLGGQQVAAGVHVFHAQVVLPLDFFDLSRGGGVVALVQAGAIAAQDGKRDDRSQEEGQDEERANRGAQKPRQR